MPTLVLTRHGQSQWNLENRFTGWWDADLTAAGEAEAKKGGELLSEAGIAPTQAFTSLQTRAIRTLWIGLHAMDRAWIPVTKHWRLNERHYGALTGLDKAQTAEKHGADQVHIWRRSYDIPPPPMDADSEFALGNDARYAGVPVPDSESLKLTLERVLPYWESAVAPVLAAGQDTLISAHGNSLRALVKHLFDVPDDVITGVEIPTGNPLVLELSDSLVPVNAAYLDTERARDLPKCP
ncbi:MAG: 2,3-diphosphoglycerate-dependent phosphoglycerate mutase [Pseudomonadota bacterium]